MKVRTFMSGYIILSLLVFSACEDFLDETPDNRVELTDLDKAGQLLTNAYSVSTPAFTDWMTDDFTYTVGTTIRPVHRALYNWEDMSLDPGEQDTPDFFWYETYGAIAQANEVLAVLDGFVVETDEEIAQEKAIRSEALLTRAYGHFMLVNLFAQHFGSSGSNEGIPYVTEPETVFLAQYDRESISRNYNDIEDDMLEGIELLDESFFNNSGKYHFNRNAALAFASRFYLYKNDFVRCLQYSNELLGDNPEAYVRDINSDEYQSSKSSTSGYPQLFSSADEQANLLLMRKVSLVQRLDFAFGIEQNFYSDLYGSNPFGATDERENPAFVKGDNALYPVRYEGLFERSSLNSNSGTPYHIGVMFKGEEVLLNRVEANIYANNFDAVISDLQVLSDRRYSGVADLSLTLDMVRNFINPFGDEGVSDTNVLLNYLFLERRKEFLGQGLRWFDVKRYDLSMEHDFDAIGGGTITLESDDLRKVLQIPQSAQDVAGLEPNPR